MAEENLLAPLDEFLKAGLHIGTRVRTKDMRTFVYKVRPDGLSVLDIEKVNERLRLSVDLLKRYKKEDIIVICRRETGWKPVKLFSELTGIKAFVGRYHPGILTNPHLKDFIETKLVFVCDPIPSKNIIEDAARIGVCVMALCDSNNNLKNIDYCIPCNNKGKKSLGLVFWILSREYLKALGEIKEDAELRFKLDDFMEEE